MKKILVALVLVSSVAMARGQGNMQNNQNNQMNQGNRNLQKNNFLNLSEEEKKELNEFRVKQREMNQKEILEIKTLDLAIEKELLNEKIDWAKVEALNTEKFQKKSEMNLSCLKTKEEFEKKFGKDISLGRSHHMKSRRNK